MSKPHAPQPVPGPNQVATPAADPLDDQTSTKVSWRSAAKSAGRMVRLVLAAVSTICVGIAISLLTWAVGLSLWSWLAAEPSVAVSDTGMDQYQVRSWDQLTPKGVAVSVCVVAAILMAAMTLQWAMQRRRRAPSLAAVLVLVVWGIWGYLNHRSDGLWSSYHWVMDYPVTARLPTAVAAWLLAAAGAVAVLPAIPAIGRLAGRRWWFTGGGVIIGLISGLVATTVAMHAGNDRRYVETTTATAAPIPPPPAALGERKFTLRVSDSTGGPYGDKWRIQAAGPGFVTYSREQVTAYAADGTQRWHYRRTGPGNVRVESLHVFDAGQTVVVRLGYHSVLIGLDAMTGQQLWMSNDAALLDAYDHRRSAEAPFLVSAGGEDHQSTTWTRFDTRTGTPLWTIPSPAAACNSWSASWQLLVAAFLCSANKRADIRFVALDPQTGQQQWHTTLARDLPYTDADRHADLFEPHTSRAGRDGYVVSYITSWAPRAPTGTAFYVNPGTGIVHDLGGNNDVADRTLDASPDFITGKSGLRSPDGQLRCVLDYRPQNVDVTSEPGVGIGNEWLGLILADEVVFALWQDSGDHSQNFTLKTFDRNTCALIATLPTPARTATLVSAPGVTLVARTDDTGTYVDGYN
ncbi:PQQ-binding-like beta-propeller repeat protein [Mycobacterium sp. pUA109]|uniref:outer membrane protein assembly factor BamB family protein n=1 Tax=Mycobacterium sp. pUA109 TaxID=3238982 RepID=UPI00351BCFFD